MKKFIPSEYDSTLYESGQECYRMVMEDMQGIFDKNRDELKRRVMIRPDLKRAIWEFYAVTYGAAGIRDSQGEMTVSTDFGDVTFTAEYRPECRDVLFSVE